VKASNLCVRTLIFGSFFFIVFCQFFYPFSFFCLTFYYLFSCCQIDFFIVLYFSSFFSTLLYSCFLSHVILSLVNPNLLRTKMLDCCYCYYRNCAQCNQTVRNLAGFNLYLSHTILIFSGAGPLIFDGLILGGRK
jgi:hypothetical protein